MLNVHICTIYVRLVTLNGIIHAHKFELCKASSVFHKQFFQKNEVINTSIVSINDYTRNNFFEMIRMIYTDEVTITKENFDEMLELSIQYKLDVLELVYALNF